MRLTSAEVSDVLGPFISELAEELGEPIAPELLPGMINEVMSADTAQVEMGAAGAGRVSSLLEAAIIGIVLVAFEPEISKGREYIEHAITNLNASRFEEIIELAREQLPTDYNEHEIRVAVRTSLERARDKKRK